MASENASLQSSIFLPQPEGAQSYDTDKFAAPLEEHARRLGVIGKPLRFHEHQRAKLTSLCNDGSTLVIARVGDLVRTPSDLGTMQALMRKGVRIWVAELGNDLAASLPMLMACSAAWRSLETDIARLHELNADDRRRAAEREKDLAEKLTMNLIRAGVVLGVKAMVESAYPVTPHQAVAARDKAVA